MTWPDYDPLTAAWNWLRHLAGVLTEPGSPFWWPTIVVTILAFVVVGFVTQASLREMRAQSVPVSGRAFLRQTAEDLGLFVLNSALPFLLPFQHRIASIDSQAYGVSARQAARRAGVSKSDHFVAVHMARWVSAQHAQLASRPLRLPHHRPADPAPTPSEPWEAAISQARAEIRDLIESGDLDHDEMTAPWVEQWAADIYRDRIAH